MADSKSILSILCNYLSEGDTHSSNNLLTISNKSIKIFTHQKNTPTNNEDLSSVMY
jgi:hypothetical protein